MTAAGKTGTTNAYRDAWFDGFTGNYVCTVWFGNDDSTSMNNMTGGSLPARTWHEIMAYAHQGIELKNPYGVRRPRRRGRQQSGARASSAAPSRAPDDLVAPLARSLTSIEDMFDAAERKPARRPGTSAANVPVRAAAVEYGSDVQPSASSYARVLFPHGQD